jgi:hypothetical protein
MITLEAIRAAVLSELPWEKLDDLVRAEMAAGRRVKDIAKDFAALAEGVWSTPDLPEDGQDAFGDTYDALIGNCHRSQWYEDPPNTSLPTEEEISQLPIWAQVALAARCARRVVALFPIGWAGPATRWRELRRIVTYCEESASIAHTSNRFVGVTVGKDDQSGPELPVLVSNVVIAAAGDANFLQYSDVSRYTDGAGSSFPTVQATAAVLTHVIPVEPLSSIRRDFDNLLRQSEYRHWDNDTPVPPDVFGPLWPEGAPAGWPADPDVPQRDEFVTTAAVKDSVPSRYVVDELLNVFNAINRYYIARTGQRLTLEGDLPLLFAALVPEGSAT